jgi:hypothetical protein
VDDTDGDFDSGGDGADGFAALAAGEDGGAFVVVDHGTAAADPAASAGCVQAVLGLADDVAAAVFGQGEGQVEDEGAFGVLAGGDALQHLDADAALEQVVEDDQPFQEIATEPVDLLDGQQVAVADGGQRVQQVGPVVGGELAADLLLEDPPADGIEGGKMSSLAGCGSALRRVPVRVRQTFVR